MIIKFLLQKILMFKWIFFSNKLQTILELQVFRFAFFLLLKMQQIHQNLYDHHLNKCFNENFYFYN
jgi:hypothetical protein